MPDTLTHTCTHSHSLTLTHTHSHTLTFSFLLLFQVRDAPWQGGTFPTLEVQQQQGPAPTLMGAWANRK